MSLEVKNLSYKYRNGKGIDNISFDVEDGEILAIIGPNGAGKTTLLKTIMGLYKGVYGTVQIDGREVSNDDMAIMLSDDILIEKLSVYQMLSYFVSMKDLQIDINDALIKYNLYDYANEKIKNLSQGTRKRLALLLTIIADPKVIILDEPTNGLDIDSIFSLKKLLDEKKMEKKCIIITSHILDFVDNIADKSLFIKNGAVAGSCENGAGTLENTYFAFIGDGNK